MKKLIVLCFIAIGSIFQYVRGSDFQTFIYYENDSVRLKLDLFLPETNKKQKNPLVIYVHGGGFGKGDRTGGHKLAKHLVKNDIAAASITYTLYMKDKDFGCSGITSEKVKAIQIAVNQLWKATEYLVNRSEDFSIDPGKIFIAGSSAGAETVLHAAFWDRKEMALDGYRISTNFNYGGVIAGAGAIMDLNLITKNTAIPLMLFHGSDDPVVPYATAAHHYCKHNATGWLMLFGSYSIYEHVATLGGTAQLTSFIGGNHSFHGAFFYQNQQPVVNFIHDVMNNKEFQKHLMVHD